MDYTHTHIHTHTYIYIHIYIYIYMYIYIFRYIYIYIRKAAAEKKMREEDANRPGVRMALPFFPQMPSPPPFWPKLASVVVVALPADGVTMSVEDPLHQ